MTHRHQGETGEAGPPKRDPSAVSRVASRVELESIALTQLQFLVSQEHDQESFDAWGLGANWTFARDDEQKVGRLETFFTFSINFDDEPEGDQLAATYRVRYTVERSDALSEQDFHQFVHWNAVFNGWPYWRELVHSLTMRSDLGPVLTPVFKMPAGNQPESEEE